MLDDSTIAAGGDNDESDCFIGNTPDKASSVGGHIFDYPVFAVDVIIQ